MKFFYKILNYRLLFILVAIFLIVSFFDITYSEEVLENGVQVQADTELTYYLDVHYDGVDKNGVRSSDSQKADITSKDIDVVDKLPVGLTFERFIGNSGDQIGAVLRSDSSVGCLGYVENGFDGLKYDEATHTVSFKIRNMQAGCKITVGIVTKTPSSADDPNTPDVVESRRDFYNTADGSELNQSIRSNTVHVWMGQEGGELYVVKYEYDGNQPANAPALPTATGGYEMYSANSIVSVASPVILEGYDFIWETNDVDVVDGMFTMPAKQVTFTGKFTRKATRNVIYELSSSDNPSEYILPGNNGVKEYYVNSTVSVDSLKAGDVINGYKFSGWTTTDVIVDDGSFVMPNREVIFTGSFEKIKYNVSYAFQGTILPPNSDNYVPATQKYAPGDIVNLPSVSDVEGYEFAGWIAEDNFVMPDRDIVIYGEWVSRPNYFEPKLSYDFDDRCSDFEKFNGTCYLFPNERRNVTFIIENDSTIDMKNVLVKIDDGYEYENLKLCDWSNNCTNIGEKVDEYTYEFYKIPADSRYIITAEIITKDKGGLNVINFELLGALADNNWFLVEKEYKIEIPYYIKPKFKVCNTLDGISRNSLNRYIISSEDYSYGLTVKDNDCSMIYLTPGIYNVTQLSKQDYSVKEVIGINGNGSSIEVSHLDEPNDIIITFNNVISNNSWFRLWDDISGDIKDHIHRFTT